MANWENLPSTATPLNASNLETLYSLKRGSNVIASNTDLDTLTTVGSYRCESATIANSLVNCPHKTSAFKLIVENLANTARYRQTIYANNELSTTYVRTLSASGTWGEWINQSNGNVYTGNLTYNTTYVVGTPDQYHYCRSGNVVQISFRAQLADSIPNATTIITLPYNHPIASEVDAFKGTRYTRDNTHFMYVTSGTNQIKTSTWNETNKYIHITHTYITDEN